MTKVSLCPCRTEHGCPFSSLDLAPQKTVRRRPGRDAILRREGMRRNSDIYFILKEKICYNGLRFLERYRLRYECE